MPQLDEAAPYGLVRPTVDDARVAVHRAHGLGASGVWTELLAAAGLAGHETDDAALQSLLSAMATLDPITQLLARSIRIRNSTYTHLAAAHASHTVADAGLANVAAGTDAGSDT